MYKLSEQLIDKYLMKRIGEITIEICNRDFDSVFQHFKAHGSGNDTTIGATYRELEKRAKEAVYLRFTDFMNEVTDEMGMVRRTTTENPFAEIAYQLWESFLDYYDIKGAVESWIGEEWSEKREKLEKAGIIDENGDAI